MSAIAGNTPMAEALAGVTELLRCSTVQVRGRRWGVGSGVVWRSLPSRQSSVIVTNAHVLSATQAVVEASDGRTLKARVIAHDAQADLAALVIATGDLPTAMIGDSDQVRVGELVLAVGNPWGVAGALTTGIIHTVCPLQAEGWIQADLRLAPGNSGGPLANAQGQVIGINSMIVNGLAIAIPSNAVNRFLTVAQVDVA